jgi:hypothetical protein
VKLEGQLITTAGAAVTVKLAEQEADWLQLSDAE